MPAPTAISLCSGAGQLDAGVHQITGSRTVVYAEQNPHAATVMAARLPGVKNLGDIAAIDYRAVREQYAPTEVIAGWPCQGISHNGHRLGLDDPRSGLWRSVAHAIQVIEPERVFLENVAALKTRGLPTVAANLNELGYDLYWMISKASDVGAAHTRPRFIGYATPGAGITIEVPAPPALHPPLPMLPPRKPPTAQTAAPTSATARACTTCPASPSASTNTGTRRSWVSTTGRPSADGPTSSAGPRRRRSPRTRAATSASTRPRSSG
ncbi:DNA cytosine methyltransferase [Streptomyces eurythermus]